jgi:hypothetical protein
VDHSFRYNLSRTTKVDQTGGIAESAIEFIVYKTALVY